MRKCPSCGTEFQDNVNFCENCGTPTEEVIIQAEPAPIYNEPVPAYSEPYNPAPKKKRKKRKGLLITLIVIAVLLIAGVVTGLLTDWFGLASPMKKIFNAIEKTAKAESMTVNISFKETYRYDGETHTDENNAEFKYVINPDAEQLTVWGSSEDGSEILLVDNVLYKKYTYGDSTRAYIYDDSIDIDEFFEMYNEYINCDSIFDMEKIEDLIDELGLSEYVDTDELESLLKEAMTDYIFNTEWLEDAAGLEKSGNTYTFEPNIKKILKDAIELCEDSDAFDDEIYDELIEGLNDLIDEWEDVDVEELKLSITLSKKMIKEVEFIIEADDYSFEITISVSDINKTEISDDEIDEFADEVNGIIAENMCSYCGEVDYYDDHGNCLDCGEHYTYSYGNGYCYDCYYSSSSSDYGYCDFCGDYEYLYSYYGGYDLCWDCYYYYYY